MGKKDLRKSKKKRYDSSSDEDSNDSSYEKSYSDNDSSDNEFVSKTKMQVQVPVQVDYSLGRVLERVYVFQGNIVPSKCGKNFTVKMNDPKFVYTSKSTSEPFAKREGNLKHVALFSAHVEGYQNTSPWNICAKFGGIRGRTYCNGLENDNEDQRAGFLLWAGKTKDWRGNPITTAQRLVKTVDERQIDDRIFLEFIANRRSNEKNTLSRIKQTVYDKEKNQKIDIECFVLGRDNCVRKFAEQNQDTSKAVGYYTSYDETRTFMNMDVELYEKLKKKIEREIQKHGIIECDMSKMNVEYEKAGGKSFLDLSDCPNILPPCSNPNNMFSPELLEIGETQYNITISVCFRMTVLERETNCD